MTIHSHRNVKESDDQDPSLAHYEMEPPVVMAEPTPVVMAEPVPSQAVQVGFISFVVGPLRRLSPTYI